MTALAVYGLAALGEIAGCFAFGAWLRLGKSAVWVLPGMMSLAVFAVLLARIDVSLAGRAFAAYGGVYIVASLLWLWWRSKVSGRTPGTASVPSCACSGPPSSWCRTWP